MTVSFGQTKVFCEESIGPKTLQDKLNLICEVRKNKGHAIDEFLQPGLSRAQIDALTKGLPFRFPEELYVLYTWHNGMREDSSMPFMFRDHRFLPLEEALEEYKLIQRYYGAIPLVERSRILLKECFPFAGLEGSYLSLAAKPQSKLGGKRPVVYIGEGTGLFFYSMDAMLDTVLEWQQSDQYDAVLGAVKERSVELEIWNKHNPGIFDP